LTLDSASLAIMAASSIIGFQLFAIWIVNLWQRQKGHKDALWSWNQLSKIVGHYAF